MEFYENIFQILQPLSSAIINPSSLVSKEITLLILVNLFDKGPICDLNQLLSAMIVLYYIFTLLLFSLLNKTIFAFRIYANPKLLF